MKLTVELSEVKSLLYRLFILEHPVYKRVYDKRKNSARKRNTLTVSYNFISPIQEPTETSKHPIRTGYLDHVTGYQPIMDQYFMVRSVPAPINQLTGERQVPHTLNSVSLSFLPCTEIFIFLRFLFERFNQEQPLISSRRGKYGRFMGIMS